MPPGDQSTHVDRAHLSESRRRLLTDGGQAQVEEPEETDDETTDESDGADETDADADQDTDDAKSDETQAGDEETEDESESEEDDEAETADEEDEGQAESEEDKSQAGDEEAEDESEEDDKVETADEEDEGEADESEGHAGDAEAVYESEETAGVAHLDLDGLYLDVLGLEVNLNEVTLDVSARPGSNNLLGNLLSAVSGLLDGPGGQLEKVTSLLSGAGERLKGVLSSPAAFLRSMVSKPKDLLAGLFGFATSDEDEEGDQAEADEAERTGRLARAVGWLKDRLVGLIPGLPVEELVATIVREVLQTMIDQLEPEQAEEVADQAEAAT